MVASVLVSLLHSLRFLARSRAALHLEILALRHQLAVVNRTRRPRLRLTSTDRLLWAWLSRTWGGWRSVLRIVKPETVVGWHRRGFRLFWIWKSRRRTGRPGVVSEVGLRRVLASYVAYYMRSRTHLALAKDCPIPRAVHGPSGGRIVATPEVGGLHHRYDRVAA